MALYTGFIQLGAGLSVGLAGLSAGFAIGIVGDAGVRGVAQQVSILTRYVTMRFVRLVGYSTSDHTSKLRTWRKAESFEEESVEERDDVGGGPLL